MSFLCVLNKQKTLQKQAEAIVDNLRLTQLLCPYQGDMQTVALTNGQLFVSSIGDVQASVADTHSAVCTIPKNTHKNPQTSWLEIQIKDDALSFQTDPLGTFPLWVFEDEKRLVITSEVKSLMALTDTLKIEMNKEDLLGYHKRPANFSPYQNVRRIQPGASVSISSDIKLSETGGFPLIYTPDAQFESIEEGKAALADSLIASAEAINSEGCEWGTYLSGGIDSSTATSLMKKLVPGLRTYTLGTEYGNEYDEAGELAAYLGTQHNEIFASSEDATRHFERAVFCNETIDGLTAETLAQLSVLSTAAAKNVTKVVTGYGADLLFGSMLRHELYMKVTGVNDLQSLIERTCWSGEFSPFFAWSLGIEIHHLFWDPQVMNTAFRIPDDANFDGNHEKVPLRNLAVENDFMLQGHAFRIKRAMTDGTQFNRVLSGEFNLDDNYSYDKKSERCIVQLDALYNA